MEGFSFWFFCFQLCPLSSQAPMPKNALQPYVPGIRYNTVMMGNVIATLLTNTTTTAHALKVTNIVAIGRMVTMIMYYTNELSFCEIWSICTCIIKQWLLRKWMVFYRLFYSMYCIWYFLQSVIISLAHAVMNRRRRMCLNHVPRGWDSILSWIRMSLSPCSRMQATAHAPEMKYPLVIETIVIAIFIKQEKSAKLQNIKNHIATYFSSLLKVHQKTICFHTQDSLCT